MYAMNVMKLKTQNSKLTMQLWIGRTPKQPARSMSATLTIIVLRSGSADHDWPSTPSKYHK